MMILNCLLMGVLMNEPVAFHVRLIRPPHNQVEHLVHNRLVRPPHNQMEQLVHNSLVRPLHNQVVP